MRARRATSTARVLAHRLHLDGGGRHGGVARPVGQARLGLGLLGVGELGLQRRDDGRQVGLRHGVDRVAPRGQPAEVVAAGLLFGHPGAGERELVVDVRQLLLDHGLAVGADEIVAVAEGLHGRLAAGQAAAQLVEPRPHRLARPADRVRTAVDELVEEGLVDRVGDPGRPVGVRRGDEDFEDVGLLRPADGHVRLQPTERHGGGIRRRGSAAEEPADGPGRLAEQAGPRRAEIGVARQVEAPDDLAEDARRGDHLKLALGLRAGLLAARGLGAEVVLEHLDVAGVEDQPR